MARHDLRLRAAEFTTAEFRARGERSTTSRSLVVALPLNPSFARLQVRLPNVAYLERLVANESHVRRSTSKGQTRDRRRT